MSKITFDQIIEIYKVAKAVNLKELEFNNGINKLVIDLDINPTYASIFIANLNCLLRGKVFKRTMITLAFDYYLSQIVLDYGLSGLKQSLNALQAHINYLENHTNSRKKSLREVLTKYDNELFESRNIIDLDNEFQKQVSSSFELSKDERKKRINQANTTPKIKYVLTKVYTRNPHIVAERLELANGICDICHKPAPFNKLKDGKPYLEVHHKIQLANGGHDTLKNTEALCPNCHRWKHFGIA